MSREPPPKDIKAVLDLQSNIGQWRLCERLYHALGHTRSTIPVAPEGVKDWRWATALAVIFLRRRPDVIDDTYIAYSRAIAWVDEPLLKEAHKRLPPAGLYYPVDEQASSQGRWQEQAREALDECGYAYFLPPDNYNTPEEELHANHNDDDDDDDDDDGIGFHNERPQQQFGSDPPLDVLVADGVDTRNTAACENYGTPSHSSDARARAGGRRRDRQPATSEALGVARSRRKVSAERGDELEQSHGLRSELKRAIRAARATLKEGDRVESRWWRPTRLDKPRVDPNAWHVGRLVAVHKDGTVDVVFEDGGEGGERLSGTPAKHVRLAPHLDRFHPPSPNPKEAVCKEAVCKRVDPSPLPVNLLCSASRRKLAHIAVATTSLRCTWEDPIPFGEELTRLRKLKGENRRCRPEWRGSFPAVNFQATKNLSFACGKAVAPAQDRGDTMRQRIHRAQRTTLRGKRRSTTSPALPGVPTELAMTQEERRNVLECDGTGEGIPPGGVAPYCCYPALVEAQSNLVAAAMAYDKCVTEVRRCLERGSAAFLVARTYSEQQTAFEETTAALGPAQPARAGYTDWRGTPIVGLQNATLDAVEAMDAWATEWTAARNNGGGSTAAGIGIDPEREKNSCQDENEEESSPAPCVNNKAPPFLWEGLPLVSTIIGHSGSIVAGASEIRQWYGSGFPSARNPFFLAYPIDDRPVTPRDVLVRAYANGEMVTTTSPMLVEEREKEEEALKAVLDKQSAAPSWWPAAQGIMGESHYARIRKAEKFIIREERRVVAESASGSTSSPQHEVDQPSG